MQLSNEQLKNIVGGAVTGAIINSLVRGINSLLEVGRSLGTAIRRIIDNSICPL